MNFRAAISRLPAVGAFIAKSMGWEKAMFGDLMDGGASSTGDLTRPYARSAWVRAAIDFVADPISMRPLCFTADKRGGDVVIDNAELTAFWEKPGKCRKGKLNRAEFVKATAGWMKLKGQAFWIMDDTWLMPRSKKSPLILAKPSEMHAVFDGYELLGWTWMNAKGVRSSLIPEQVIHLSLWNPYHDILGLSEWEGAMIAAESDYAAGTFARNLAKNNGDRGPYVIGKGGQFSDEQIKQVSAQLRQKRELGRRGEFRAAFLPADVDVKEPSVNAVDSSYVAQRLENRKEIFMAFGVPPSYADPQASYSIGSASDRFRLIEDTCMPLAAKIADGMEVVSERFLGGRNQTVFVEFDWDSHSTMQAVRAERFETATKAVGLGMPWHKASEYFRLKLPRFAGDKIGRIAFNLTEIPPDGSDEADTTDATNESDPVEDLEKLFAERAQARCKTADDHGHGPNCRCPKGQLATGERKAMSAKALAQWQQARKLREPWEKKFQSKVSRFLMDARAETLRNIAAATTEKSLVTKDLSALTLVFDLGKWLDAWTKGLLATDRAAIEQAGIEVWNELGRDDPMTQPAAEVLQALRVRENRLKGAGEKVWENIVGALEEGIQKGETMDQLSNRVKQKFSALDKSRSLAIAKTETTVCYETARDMAFRAAGVQWKQWLTSQIDAERHNIYPDLNEQIVAVDEKFKVGNYDMAYPGDPEGPAGEVVNCNCVTIAVAGPDANDIEGNDGDFPY